MVERVRTRVENIEETFHNKCLEECMHLFKLQQEVAIDGQNNLVPQDLIHPLHKKISLKEYTLMNIPKIEKNLTTSIDKVEQNI